MRLNPRYLGIRVLAIQVLYNFLQRLSLGMPCRYSLSLHVVHCGHWVVSYISIIIIISVKVNQKHASRQSRFPQNENTPEQILRLSDIPQPLLQKGARLFPNLSDQKRQAPPPTAVSVQPPSPGHQKHSQQHHGFDHQSLIRTLGPHTTHLYRYIYIVRRLNTISVYSSLYRLLT